jgi:CRISPR-associated endonuclease/helicase Cas3
MLKPHFAHSLAGRPTSEWQPLKDHLANVAETALKYASTFHSENWAWNAAWLHDIGKLADEFQAYLLRENSLDDEEYEGVGHGRVNHSSAGAALSVDIFSPIHGLSIAYIVAGHHAGLPDYYPTDTGRAALQIRLSEGKENLRPIRDKAEKNMEKLSRQLHPPEFVKADNFHHWIRMLFSCLVDADFLDTENFINPVLTQNRAGYLTLPELKIIFDAHINRLVAEADRTPVNVARQDILKYCKRAAQHASGLFTLNVPTGGGKTLSGIAFALDHAVMHDKCRIIYVIPYTSIIEQTAGILSNIFGTENVVEHHSNLDPDRETQRSRLASENWDAPIIVTTNVQFFESLYVAKPSRCRKLHNIINSVVILDEAQLLPPEFLDPCVEVISQLVSHYGVTMLLSTATQPALPKLDRSREIVADPVGLYERLRRTKINMPPDLNQYSDWQDIAERAQQHDQVLCVVNTRRDCYELHQRMPEGTTHLSALMCGEHRSGVIRKIKKRLKDGFTTRVVSTQLVEAGVDIDFPVIYRALAGLDSIVQAAGRCNREGRLNETGRLGQVHVFVPPNVSPRGLLLKAENTTRELIATKDFSPEDPKEFSRYFEHFYSRLNDTGGSFLKSLQKNVPHVPFRTAGDLFRLIDDHSQQPVFVQYGNSGQWTEELRRIGPKRLTLRRLQRFTVNISKRDFEKAKTDGLVDQIWPGFWLWVGKYDPSYGLDLFGSGWAPEDLMV